MPTEEQLGGIATHSEAIESSPTVKKRHLTSSLTNALTTTTSLFSNTF